MVGAFKSTKYTGSDKYKYSEYGIGLDSRGNFFPSGKFAQNVIIFGTDVSSSVYIDNRGKIF